MNFEAITYKIPPQKKVIKLIGTTVAMTVLINIMPTFLDDHVVVLFVDLAIILCGLAYLSYVFFFEQKMLTLVDDKVLFIKRKKIVEAFSLYDCEITSYVVHHYVNGLPSGADLIMRILHNGNLYERKCTHFGKKQYNEFMSEIDNRYHHLRNLYQATVTPEQQVEVTSSFIGTREFYLNKEDVLAVKKTVLIILAVVFGIFTMILTVSFAGIRNISLRTIMLIPMPYLGVFGVILFVQIRRIKNGLLSLKVMPDMIIANDKQLAKTDIKKIRLTPPSYHTTGTREIEIITTTGTHKWNYGNMRDNTTRKQYVDLVHTLQLFSADTIGLLELRRI